jgi:hypothetical protein
MTTAAPGPIDPRKQRSAHAGVFRQWQLSRARQ